MPRQCKDWIEAFLAYTEETEHPDSFRKWGAIAAIAGALQRKVCISQGLFTWYPNFYIFLVGPSGRVSKTTSNRNAMALLRAVEGVKFGPRSATWQALVQRMANSTELFPITNGVSLEESIYLEQSALIVEAGELGTFLDPQDRQSVDVFVDLYDCPEGAWDKWTKTVDSDVVVNPWLSLLGACTPAWIAENCSSYFIEGGFASRSIFIYEERKRKLVAYPSMAREIDSEKLRLKLIDDLKEINSLVGEYKLTSKAVAWGQAWYEQHNNNAHPFWDNERFGGYMSRKQSHMHKLAMVRAASRHSELVISEADLIWADQEITKTEKYLPLVYGKVDQDRDARFSAQILARLAPAKKMAKTILLQHFAGSMTLSNFDEAVNMLIQGDLIRQFQDGQDIFIEFCGDREALKRVKGEA